MRICRARFETLGSNQRRLSNKRQQDSLTPLQKKSPSPLFPKKTSPLKPVLPLLFICASQHRPHQVHSYIVIYLTAVTGGSCRSLGTILCFGAPLGSHLPHIPVCLLSAQGDFSVDTKYRYSLRHCVFLCVMLTYSLKFVNTLFCEFKRLHIFQELPQNEVLCHHILHEDSDRSSGLKRLK